MERAAADLIDIKVRDVVLGKAAVSGDSHEQAQHPS
jgi:hypothetical protein